MKLNTTRGLASAVAAIGLGLVAPGVAAAHEGHPHGLDPGQTKSQLRGVDTTCDDEFRRIKGLGRACAVDDGLVKVELQDGSTVLTHAADDPKASGTSRMLGGTPRRPKCGTTRYFRAIIALPSDVTGDKTAASLRSEIDTVNGAFHASAVESGSPSGADLLFLCDGTGQVRVDAVRLPTALAQTTWATILSNLKALGYDSASEKYAVYFDARVAGETCGRGSFWGDSTDSASNWNNTGRMYAVEYDCNEPATLMHEMGHNLGAVQDAAPFSTGSGMHCFEGYDVMCYNDEGSRDPGSIVWNCPTRPDRFDCGHDSYFDAKIGFGEGGGAGSFLDTNWNIGECYVAFVVNYACSNADTTAPAMTSLTRTVASGQQVEAAGRVPVTVNWAAIDAVGVTSYDAYVRAAGGDWESVSSGASTGATRFLAAGTSFEFAVRAFDRAGNTSAWKYLTVPVQAHQETSSAITFYGSWTTAPWAEAFGGSLRFASTTSSWTKLTFTGSQVAWVASKATNRGAAYVWLDDVYQGYVDLYNATTRPRSVVLTKSVDPSRMHTLTIQPIGTSGRPTIDVDAFVVLG